MNDTLTLLFQNIHGMLRLVQKPHMTTLQAFTGAGFQAVALDDDALQAFLVALPVETLQAALGLLEATVAQPEDEEQEPREGYQKRPIGGEF